MKRRTVIKIAASALAVGGTGVFTLSKVFKPEISVEDMPGKLEFSETKSNWIYCPLDPGVTADLAYRYYNTGSCMYAVFKSVVSQLADKIGEPFASFPTQMMKYGHSGIGGFGSVCGALNGAAAVVGLLVDGKEIQDALIADLFHWYENASFPKFIPAKPTMDFTPPTSVSNSILCHVSTTTWGKTGYRVKSDERKERCRRLSGDVAARTVVVLNRYFNNAFITNGQDHQTVENCMACHGNEGKLGNTSGEMNCSTCHTKSVGHRVFGDIHYKLMKRKK